LKDSKGKSIKDKEGNILLIRKSEYILLATCVTFMEIYNNYKEKLGFRKLSEFEE